MMDDITILVVAVEESLLGDLKEYFTNYRLTACADPEIARNELQQTHYDLLIVDERMPALFGLEFLREAKTRQAYAYGIVLTADADKDLFKTAINQALARKILEMPLQHHQLQQVLAEALIECRQKKADQRNIEFIKEEYIRLRHETTGLRQIVIGLQKGLKEVFLKAQSVAVQPVNVLITGETGTGKDVIANEIHELSPRNEHHFIKVHCAAIPEDLLEKELFGYVKGAFPGAVTDKPGKLELANRGTLFINGICEMPLEIQAKLVRALQEKEIERLGSHKRMSSDVRLICAASRDLKERINDQLFREDLYYRIATFPIHIPPLRERKEDIRVLIEYFLEQGCRDLGLRKPSIPEVIMKQLCVYDWPGNMREVENAVMRAVISSHGRETLDERAFVFLFADDATASCSFGNAIQVLRDSVIEHEVSVKDIEAYVLNSIVEYYDGNVARAVKQTGISKDRFYRSRRRFVEGS